MRNRVIQKLTAYLAGLAILAGSAGMYGISAFAAESLTDDLATLSQCDAAGTTSANIGFSKKDLSAHGITDTSRVYKLKDDGDLDSQTYLVYQTQKEFESISLEAAYLKKNGQIAGDIQFETSPDGVAYTPFPQMTKTVDTGGLGRQLLEKNRV